MLTNIGRQVQIYQIYCECYCERLENLIYLQNLAEVIGNSVAWLKLGRVIVRPVRA